VLRRGEIDLLFLDIQMPDLSGIQLLRSLQKRPLVIFTTAFSKYATEGFDLDAVDYLLKPYPFDRFLKAVNKVHDYLDLHDRAANQAGTKEPAAPADFLFVRADYKLTRINLKDIQYVEGLKDYIKIYVNDKPVLTQMSMKTIGEKLPAQDFIRVHRSFIVAFDKIDFVQKQVLTVGKREIPVGDLYREQLFTRINFEKPTD
jgi:DNA-binding LytR/AlgR family response regulator